MKMIFLNLPGNMGFSEELKGSYKMTTRKKFEKSLLTDEIELLSKSLTDEIEIFLIGGLAMIYHGLKNATKDIDVILNNKSQAIIFRENLKLNGFSKTNPINNTYSKLEAFSIFEKPNGYRFDIFIKKVCGKLVLSNKMKDRSNNIYLAGKLNMNIISLEDIFLFKSITNRDDDLADMSIIAGAGLNWDIIRDELRGQPDSWRWYVIFYQNLIALEEKYSIQSPLKGQFEKDAEISIGVEVALLKLQQGPMLFSELLRAIDDNEDFSREVINKLKKFDLVYVENGLLFLK